MIKHLIGFVGTSQAGKSTLSNMTHGLILSKLHDEEGNKAISNWRLNEFGRLEIETDTYDPETQEFSPQFNELDVDNRSADFQMWARGEIWGWVKSMSIAFELKKACKGIFGLNYSQIYGNGKKTETEYTWKQFCNILQPEDVQDIKDKGLFDVKMSGRDIMEILGSKIIRKIDEDIYIKRLIHQLKSETSHLILVTDVRRFNEARFLQENGAILIRLTRGNPKNISEVDIDDIKPNFVINNVNMTQEESCQEMNKIIEELGVFDKQDD